MQCYKVFVSWEEGRTRPDKEGTCERNGESKSEPRRGKYGGCGGSGGAASAAVARVPLANMHASRYSVDFYQH